MENQMTNLKCRKCGASVSADQKKCHKCGAPILLKVMQEEEKRHLPAKEIREKDKRMRREYDKMNKEKEEKRQKDEKKQQKLDEKKERAQEKEKAELEALRAKEEKKQEKAELQKAEAEKAAAPEHNDLAEEAPIKSRKRSFPFLAAILIIAALWAITAIVGHFVKLPASENLPEDEIETLVEEPVEEVTENPAEETPETPVEEVSQEPVAEVAEMPAETPPEAPAEVAKEPEKTAEAPKNQPKKEKSTAPAPRNITRNNYMFPSDTKYLTEGEINGLSQYEIGLLRNEIYARKGYVFKNEPYKNYFNSQAWYNPNPSAKMTLSEIEKYNVNFLLEYERAQGWR